MSHILISSPAALEELAGRVAASETVTFDTEFHSEKRYWPEVCLVQVGIDGRAHLADPLTMDLTPLWQALTTGPEVVVHAGHADLEILHRHAGAVPARIFDTQLGAAFCGKGATPGYGNLVAAYLGHDLDKGPRMSDWRRRPLTDRQAEYAAADVTHLAELLPKLRDDLAARGHLDYAMEEHARYLAPERWSPTRPEVAWLSLRTRTNSGRVLNRFAHLAAWREREAARLDKPRQWILADVTLADIAYDPPKDPGGFRAARNFPDGRNNGKLIDTLAEILAHAETTPKESWPTPPAAEPEPSEAATVLRVLRDHIATRTGIAAGLIATVGDLQAFASGNVPDHLASGWRHEVFSGAADRVLSGDTALRLRNGVVSFE